MVSKNNQWQYLRASAQRVPHYGLRKLSVGVASVLLSTTLYMGVNAHADTMVTPGETSTTATTVTAPNSGATEMIGDAVGSGVNGTSANSASEVPTSQAAPDNTGVTSEKAADSAADGKAGIETPTQPATSASSTSESALPKMFVVTAVKPAANAEKTETTKLSTFTWTIHYVDENGTKLAPDTVISHDYQRTDTATTMGDYEYIDGSLKVTGTHNTGYHIDAPDFKYNVPVGKTSFDIASWNVSALSFDEYRPDYGSVVLSDQLTKDPVSLGSTSHDYSGGEFTFHYTLNPKTVTINYVNDDDNEKVVGTGTVSGKPKDEVAITPSLPGGYMLTPGKDVPSKYTMTDSNNQVVTIHVQKQFVDVSDTDPQAKQTRTITLHYVYSGGSKDGQKAFDDAVLDVYYHRTATFDRVTNQTTYGDWTWDRSQGDTSTPGYHVVSGKWTNLPQSWATVTADVPSIKGYSVDLGQNDPTNTNHVPANTWVFPTYNNAGGGGHTIDGHGATAYLDGYGYEVSPTHTIKYVPNKTTVTVNYVDDDNNGINVGHQSWDGTIGQHIDLTLTPPDNYVLTPGWVNPTSYDFDGVNSSWYTVHVKHKTQDVTDQEPKDQVTKVTWLTRNHLYGDGPHKGEKFSEPDIFDLAWKRTATKDLVTDKVTFGDWQVDRDNSKNVQGWLHFYPDNGVGGGLHVRQNGYSYLGRNTHQEFSLTDGSTMPDTTYFYGWWSDQALKYPILNVYYGPEQVKIPIYYIDADTGQQVANKVNDEALTGDDFRDGNTVTIDQSKLTSLPTTLTGYQLLPGQTLPTSYKIDTFAGVKAINVQVVKDRSVKVTFVDDDNKGAVVGTPTIITGHTGGDPVTLNLTVPNKYELAKGQQLPTTYTFTKGSGDVTVHLVHQAVERSVTIKFVDDEEQSRVPGKEAQVGQALTLTGRDGDTVDLNLTVPDKYKLADNQQLPTTYAFTKGSGDVTIHLVHQVVQRNASIDVQLKLVTNVGDVFVTTQKQWTQLKDKIKLTLSSTTDAYNMMKSVEVGILTGHVNYDLVDEEVVSFGDDWTSLKLSGQTYQLPNGTDVVNGVMVEGATYGLWGKKYKELYLEYFESQPDKYSDYINLPWHGYLSVNATNDPKNDEAAKIIGLGLQAGLVGDEPNALVKANGDHAATGVEIINKTVDLSLLKDANQQLSDSIYLTGAFSEQHGQLQTTAALPVVGVYVPYVEKTVTRTIKVTTPDGKTTTVKQTATLAKQFPSREDIHPDWTNGEWESYDVPTIDGYTASQSAVETVAVNGDTTDQTVNISYTANKQSVNVNYVDVNNGNKIVHTTTVNGVTDGDTNVPNELPAGYKLVDGQSVPQTIHFNANNNDDINIKVQHTTVTVTSDSPKTPSDKLPDNPSKSYPSGVSENDLNKTVTRTIKITQPNGTVTNKVQTVKLTRTADVDEMTGNVTYDKWTTGEWSSYEVPVVPGYTPSQSEVPTAKVTDYTKDQMVTVTYVVNDQTVHINYVDSNGKIVHTTSVTGQIGSTVDLAPQVPDGWVAYNTDIPTRVVIGANPTFINYLIAHRVAFVKPTDGVKAGDLIPGTKSKTFNDKVNANNLVTHASYTINIWADEAHTHKLATKTYYTDFIRNAAVDAVTGDVYYYNWSEGGKHVFAGFTRQAGDGYQAVVAPSWTATQADPTKTIDLVAQPQQASGMIQYQTLDDKVVSTQAFTGSKVVALTAPKGYTLMTDVATITPGFEHDQMYTVYVRPTQAFYTAADKLPEGMENLSKTITRTIRITEANGHVRTITQRVRFTRTVTVNANGSIVYSDWQATGRAVWNKVFLPKRYGYHMMIDSDLAKMNVTADMRDSVVNVKYVKD